MKKLMSTVLCVTLLISMLFTFSTAVFAEEEREIYKGRNYIFEVINNSEVKLLYYIGTDTEITTPAQLGGYPVTSIGEHAFFDSTAVNLTISEGIRTIDNEAFLYCQSLETVTLPSTLESTGQAVFRLCASLKEVTFAGVNNPRLGDYMFYGCTSLESVTPPSGLTTIFEGMFAYCHSLENISLTDCLTTIFDYAFYDSGLTEISLPENLESIGLLAFAESKSLDTVTVNCPYDIWVASDAFEGCPCGNPFEEIITQPFETDPTEINPTEDEPTEVDPDKETITVYFTNNWMFLTQNVYWWGSESENPEWPGVAMTKVNTNENGDDIYSAEIPGDATGIIFNGEHDHQIGVIRQTVDITDFKDGSGFYCVAENADCKIEVGTYSSEDITNSTDSDPIEDSTNEPYITDPQGTDPTEPPPSNPTDTITIYFVNNKYWENVFVYGFYGEPGDSATDSSLGEYPGTEMNFLEKNDFGQDTYSLEIPADIDYIRFSDGDKQGTNHRTDNIPNDLLSDDICFCLGDKDSKYWPYYITEYAPSSTSEPSDSSEPSVPPAPSVPDVSGYIGDANFDNVINIDDATTIHKYITALLNPTDEEAFLILADADQSGLVNVKDATYIQKYLAKLDTAYYVGKPYDSGAEPLLPPDFTHEGGLPVENVSAGDTITYCAYLTVDKRFENIQGAITYDPEKLALISTTQSEMFPNINGILRNCNNAGEILFNASNVDGYNFREEKVLVTVKFEVLDSNDTEIGLHIQHMTALGGELYYFFDSEPVITDGIRLWDELEVPCGTTPGDTAEPSTSEPGGEPPTSAPGGEPPVDEIKYITLFFTAGAEWETAYFYAHKYVGLESYPGNYPGKEMTYIETNSEGEKVYACKVPKDYDYVSFSDAGDSVRRILAIPSGIFLEDNGFKAVQNDDGSWTVHCYTYDGSTPDIEIPIYPLNQKFPIGPSFADILKDTDKEMSALGADISDEITEVMSVTPDGFEYGDTDLNHDVNIKDATAIQKHIVGIITFDENQLKLADVNTDGKVNIKDATHIQKHLVGNATLPGGWVTI